MSRRGLAGLVGLGALASAAGGVFGNHLPWPKALDQHPLWISTAFFALSAVWAIIAVVLFVNEPASPGAEPVVIGSSGTTIGQVGSLTMTSSPMVVARPQPPPVVDLCVGRDDEVAAVLAAWTERRSVVVLGGPGIGKSTVLGSAVHDNSMVETYASRRFVVSCEGADSARAVFDKMAQVLGVAAGDHLPNRVLTCVHEAPCLLVLDNFESVTDTDAHGAAELVRTLRSIPGRVVLGIGFRGSALPWGSSGMPEVRLDPLDNEAALQVFIAAAGGRHSRDDVGDLVAELDGYHWPLYC